MTRSIHVVEPILLQTSLIQKFPNIPNNSLSTMANNLSIP